MVCKLKVVEIDDEFTHETIAQVFSSHDHLIQSLIDLLHDADGAVQNDASGCDVDKFLSPI